jgi:hypothetical protein
VAFLAELARYSAVLELHGVLASFCGFGAVPSWASNVTTHVAGDRKRGPKHRPILLGRIEIDNNLVENTIRPTKLGQKNWLFVGSGESGRKCAIFYTIVENCRRLKIDVREYLTEVFTRLPGMLAKDAASLTPANWLAARLKKAVGRVVA